jgi:hypothetical protein
MKILRVVLVLLPLLIVGCCKNKRVTVPVPVDTYEMRKLNTF